MSSEARDRPMRVKVLLHGAWRSSLPGSRFAAIGDEAVRVRRFIGDLANGGKGEVLVRA